MAEDLDQELVGLGVTPGWRPPSPASGDPSSLQNPQTYPMQIGGQSLAVGLGFAALAVAVDNRTGQSVFLQDAGRYVGPQTIGQVIRLPSVQRGVALFQTPPNPTGGPESPITGEMATLTFYPVPLAETAGLSVAPPSIPLPAMVTIPNQVTIERISIPAGTDAVELKVFAQNVGAANTTVRLDGRTTGWGYYPPTLMTAALTKIVIPIDAAQDQIADISVSCGATGQNGSVLVTLLRTGDEDIADRATRLLGITDVSDRWWRALGLVTVNRDPIPRGTMLTAPFDVQLAAGATLDLVAGVAGLAVYCFGLNLYIASAQPANVDLEDDTGLILSAWQTTVTGYQLRALYGAAATLGHKVRLHNSSAVIAGFVQGELVYVQV